MRIPAVKNISTIQAAKTGLKKAGAKIPKKGIADVNSGAFPDAIRNLDEAIRFNPKSDIAYFYKGIACHSIGKDEEAYKNYTKAIELNKKMTDAYFNRGQLIFNTNPKLALDDFVSAA